MNALAAHKLSALRLMLEDSEGTPILKMHPKTKVIPADAAATKEKPTVKAPPGRIELPDDEPDEHDCEKVGAVLRSVFGRKMCLDPKQSVIPGSPKVSRKPASAGTRVDRPAAKREWPESWAERAEQLGWLSEHIQSATDCNCG